MIIKTLYKYQREDGGATVTTDKPQAEYEEMFRIIADDGKLLTKDGETLFSCVDTTTTNGWYEVEDTTEISGDELKAMIEEVL